ncbi:MAG: carnitine dehydratase [Pseudomonadales bacterium]|nr:carnitine dehydratase [Pseudomonadales bacterium]RLU02284.1 MAG: CoA transferase [Ketobacter sp.]
MKNPLSDVFVISLEQAVAAPYVSSRLADAGARVIKIERAEGDFARRYDSVVKGQSAYFVWLNRGKESLVLDIKKDEDAELLETLLAEADVFIQNLAPGAASRAGFDSAALRQRYPRLITCDISGYGEEGEYAKRKAYDLLVQAETGLATITGSPEAPGRVGVSVCDIAAGMHAWAGILQALYERERTGLGQGIKVSLFDGMADWMTVPLLHQQYGGRAPERVGLNHPSIAPYGVYTIGDGTNVVFSIQNEREWHNLCEQVLASRELVDDPRFATNELRVQHRAELDNFVRKVFSELKQAEVVTRLEQASIAFGLLNTVEDLLQHPQLRRSVVSTQAGEVELVASPIRRVESGACSVSDEHWGEVPAVGQHTDAIRKEYAAARTKKND